MDRKQHGAARLKEWRIPKLQEKQSPQVGKYRNMGTQKKTKEHTNPTFDKRGIQKAKQCWRRFPQYVIMTPNIDFNEMTLDPEVIQQNRDDLKHRIKDLIIWALGKAAITEMTRTVGENDQTRRDINHLYSLFRMHFIQERNKFHSHAVLSPGSRTKQLKTYGQKFYKYKGVVSSKM